MLEPGDVLYLPRGWLHAAQAQGDVSIHLTLGIHSWTRYALAEQLAQSALAMLREDPQMRRTLPLGVDGPAGEIDFVRERLVAAVTEADSAPLFHRTRRGHGRPAPLGPLAQLKAVDGLGPESPVRLREALEARLEGARLTTRVGWLDFPESDLPSVTRLLDGEVRTAGDLGVELVERLLRAGVLVPADSDAAAVTATERFFCSDAARIRGDSIVGTAPHGLVWVLIEYRGGWPPNGFDGLNLEPAVKTLVFAAAQAIRARVLLVRRHGRPAARRPRSLGRTAL